ncbi:MULTISPECIES: H-NS family nucleoid-associated regulatory protein [unclassified Duganella]|uniref:H-NS histone family protein n=1 Tax=unclassified Duganella TaxID=2636909 RepID=UPI00088D86DE|nr:MULTISPECIES: H-NS histone family protein [unclassified Duganella]SDG28014.1 DNA-binding protein H-NS [Duganella sp. OV458]SDK72636.1 DNA-binding protein H-NS [Duganella sp. OV510]
MDVTNLSSAELRQLQERVKQELKQRESQDLAKAREEIFAIAKSVGVSVQDLVGSGASARAKTGPVAPRYRNPADASQQWTGRGRQPQWVKDWLDAGNDISGLKL